MTRAGHNPPSTRNSAMKYRRLGKTNLRVSVVGVGTWQFGGEWGKEFTQDEVTPILSRARDLGINLIDTAECYGDHTSEALIGGAIERNRDQWIIATKFGHKFHGLQDRTDERRPELIERQLEDSLRALRTDYVDIWQYHSWRDAEFDDEDVQNTVNRMMQQGKVRHIGNSIAMSIDHAHQVDASPKAQVQMLQLLYNRLDRRPEQYAFARAIELDLGVMARVPLASGFLTGKYRPGARFTGTDYRAGKKPQEIDAILEQVEQIRRNELPPGVDMATWAIAWCLRHPAVSCVIPGVKSIEQLESNARAAELDEVRTDHPRAWRD
jgi:aryl-alcohol dehydrogenase-like predicted oxidoreductase